MEHLEFIQELEKLGISIRSTNIENKEKIVKSFNKRNDLSIKNFEVKYVNNDTLSRRPPLQQLIINGIDMGEWAYSRNYNITPENYDRFIEIIQNKIRRNANDLDILMTVYFQLRHEISQNNY